MVEESKWIKSDICGWFIFFGQQMPNNETDGKGIFEIEAGTLIKSIFKNLSFEKWRNHLFGFPALLW